MSTQVKSFFITALFLFGAVVVGTGNNEPGSSSTGFAVVPVKGSQTFKIIYKSESAGRVKLNLYDVKRRLIFTESSMTDGFIRPLNFNGLDAGKYTVELVDGLGKKVETIDFQPKKESKFFHVSKLLKEDGKFLVAIVNNSSNENVTIRIYDSASNLVYSEQKEISGNFAQIYTVKQPAGRLTFEISDNNGTSRTMSF